MSRDDYPITPAVRLLREKDISFTPHLYPYEEHGGTRVSSQCLQVPEHEVVKTLVMETEDHRPLLVLMHGDREVSTRQLARVMGVRAVSPCNPSDAQKHTGYLVGGTSPFGTRKTLPVYVESTILGLSRLYINGGKRGFLVGLNPTDLNRAISIVPVSVAIAPSPTCGTLKNESNQFL